MDRSQGGLGVGLTIVQRVVELHGGKVSAHSAGLGHGSEFVVRLPLSAEVNEQPRSASSNDAARSRMRVLVVDDNKDAADSVALLLRHKGHDVRVAYSSESALETAAEFRPEAALLDIGLPRIDGYELARRLRESSETNHMAIIAITGYGRDTDLQVARDAGFDAHLVKPVEPAQMEQTLADLATRLR